LGNLAHKYMNQYGLCLFKLLLSVLDIWLCFNKVLKIPFWENGYVAICMKERLGGELWWILNMTACKMGVVLIRFLGWMGWGYRRISGGVWECFPVIPNLRCEMAPRLDSGKARGVVFRPLRKLFRIYIVLLALRMLP